MKKKIVLYLFLTFLASSYCFAFQNDDTTRTVHICEKIASNELDTLYECFTSNNFEQFAKTMDNWTQQCGMSELPLRLIILKSLINNEEAESNIELYYNSLYPLNLINRYNNAKKYYFDYVYFYNKNYYSYVNLRHKIDTLVKQKAAELLQTSTLDTNKLIICNFFAGNIDEVENLVNENDKKYGFLNKFFIKKKENNKAEAAHLTLIIGNYAPIGKEDIFCNNLIFGLAFGPIFKNKFTLDIYLKYLITNGSKSFRYDADKETRTVNSNYCIHVGAIVGYKIFESKFLNIIPKLGIGIDAFNAKYEESVNNKTFVKEIKVPAMHLLSGISFYKEISNSSGLGMEISFHYCPYQWDKSLKTNFKNFAYSFELYCSYCFDFLW
ncbi:MAG TPA: hypothetical protein PKY56_05670 [Candidatus Kapabacteria bacterium]|nr:hypothetical protein [Candidatus Kapabacteria bacterium]